MASFCKKVSTFYGIDDYLADQMVPSEEHLESLVYSILSKPSLHTTT